MTHNELVEKVAQTLVWKHAGPSDWRFCIDEANIVIAVVLEEAAKVADTHGHKENLDCCGCGEEIAAAIRALKDHNSA